MQQEENYLAQSISQVDVDARYDEGVKRLPTKAFWLLL